MTCLRCGGEGFGCYECTPDPYDEIARLTAELREAEDRANMFATKEMHTEARARKAEAERDEAKAARLAADFALVDRYRNPKSGIFLFPDDVAAIILALDKAEAERDTALAQVAAAFEAAADTVQKMQDRRQVTWAKDIRILTPTDASTALSRMLDAADAAGQVRMRDRSLEAIAGGLTGHDYMLASGKIRALPITPRPDREGE